MTSLPRYDIYAFIHKGLRAFMTHTLVRVGRLDPHDPDEVAEVTEEVRALLDICTGHLKHENHVIHSAMEARRPGSSATISDDHVQHKADIAALREQLTRIAGDPGETQALYRALSVFVGHNFEHMLQEETRHNEVLWATHSDDEIRALEHRIVSSLAPDEMRLSLRWMLPHMNPGERAAMLQGMRANAPVAVFEEVLGLIRPLLGGRGWRKLSLALGV
ncbi:MAG TPA: hemerythrin domain-containing protein [Burkholderiaceae bacterium]|nr:hemerythrin domain-containing protein [Burkholderiaceae bacterium]